MHSETDRTPIPQNPQPQNRPKDRPKLSDLQPGLENLAGDVDVALLRE